MTQFTRNSSAKKTAKMPSRLEVAEFETLGPVAHDNKYGDRKMSKKMDHQSGCRFCDADRLGLPSPHSHRYRPPRGDETPSSYRVVLHRSKGGFLGSLRRIFGWKPRLSEEEEFYRYRQRHEGTVRCTSAPKCASGSLPNYRNSCGIARVVEDRDFDDTSRRKSASVRRLGFGLFGTRRTSERVGSRVSACDGYRGEEDAAKSASRSGSWTRDDHGTVENRDFRPVVHRHGCRTLTGNCCHRRDARTPHAVIDDVPWSSTLRGRRSASVMCHTSRTLEGLPEIGPRADGTTNRQSCDGALYPDDERLHLCPCHRRLYRDPFVVCPVHGCRNEAPPTLIWTDSSVIYRHVPLCTRCRRSIRVHGEATAISPQEWRRLAAVAPVPVVKPFSLADELYRLTKYGWYWGPISREEAEDKLKGLPDGSFLVRDSSDDCLLLSLYVRSVGKTLFVRIEYGNGRFTLHSRNPSQWFPSVGQLIEHAMMVSQFRAVVYTKPVRPNALSYPVRLTKPVSRLTEVRSLQYLCRFVIRYHTRWDQISELPLPNLLKRYVSESCY